MVVGEGPGRDRRSARPAVRRARRRVARQDAARDRPCRARTSTSVTPSSAGRRSPTARGCATARPSPTRWPTAALPRRTDRDRPPARHPRARRTGRQVVSRAETSRSRKQRGHWYVGPHGIPLMPTFHPAYVLRQTGGELNAVETPGLGRPQGRTRQARRARRGQPEAAAASSPSLFAAATFRSPDGGVIQCSAMTTTPAIIWIDERATARRLSETGAAFRARVRTQAVPPRAAVPRRDQRTGGRRRRRYRAAEGTARGASPPTASRSNPSRRSVLQRSARQADHQGAVPLGRRQRSRSRADGALRRAHDRLHLEPSRLRVQVLVLLDGPGRLHAQPRRRPRSSIKRATSRANWPRAARRSLTSSSWAWASRSTTTTRSWARSRCSTIRTASDSGTGTSRFRRSASCRRSIASPTRACKSISRSRCTRPPTSSARPSCRSTSVFRSPT